jgi:predicted RNA-binding protein (virulence factor B family)
VSLARSPRKCPRGAVPNPPRLGDRSSPDAIRDAFGISKKAFKRAVGRLLKERSVVIGPDGTLSIARPR